MVEWFWLIFLIRGESRDLGFYNCEVIPPPKQKKLGGEVYYCGPDINKKLFHFEWSPPWHHIETYSSQILTFFVLKSGEDEKERIILMKSRALRSLDFIRIILSSSSLLLVRGPAVTTVIYQAKLIQTDSFSLRLIQNNFKRPGVSRRLGAWKLRFERY